jgi:hypothetical protein
MQWGLKRLQDFPRSFWLALFVEGTRFMPAKLLAAQEYAASQGLPAPRNVLIPRTKVSFLLLPDWNFVFTTNVSTVACEMLKTSPKHWQFTYSHLMQLYVKLLYIWVSVLALVDYLCLSFLLIVYWGQNSEGRHFLWQLVDIIFCSFYYDALYTFCKFWSLACFFFTFLSESFDVLTALFCVQISGICISSKYYAWFCPSYLWYNSDNP